MVNTAARSGAVVSLKDPVGLYMQSFAKDQFKLPYDSSKKEFSVNGSDRKAPPAGTFEFQRGDINKRMGLRLKIQIPDGEMITTEDGAKRQANVSDLLDTNNNDENVKYGSHFAENIQMHLYGVTIGGGKAAPAINCPCQKSKSEQIASGLATESPSIVAPGSEEAGRKVFRI